MYLSPQPLQSLYFSILGSTIPSLSLSLWISRSLSVFFSQYPVSALSLLYSQVVSSPSVFLSSRSLRRSLSR